MRHLWRTIIGCWRFAGWYWECGQEQAVTVRDEPEPVKHFQWVIPPDVRIVSWELQPSRDRDLEV